MEAFISQPRQQQFWQILPNLNESKSKVLSKLEQVNNNGSHFIRPALWGAKMKSTQVFTSSLLFKLLQNE